MGSVVDRLLDRLDQVKETSPGQWKARCPAHDDKTPSLSVTENDDRVLVHCFAGCATVDIMESIGLSLADLFDQPLERQAIKPRERWHARGLLVQLLPDVDVVLMAAGLVAEGKALSTDDHRSLCDARARILRAVELVG